MQIETSAAAIIKAAMALRDAMARVEADIAAGEPAPDDRDMWGAYQTLRDALAAGDPLKPVRDLLTEHVDVWVRSMCGERAGLDKAYADARAAVGLEKANLSWEAESADVAPMPGEEGETIWTVTARRDAYAIYQRDVRAASAAAAIKIARDLDSDQWGARLDVEEFDHTDYDAEEA